MADAHEAIGQDVEQEAAKELHGIEGHHLLAVVIAVVLVVEANAASVEGDQAVLGDGDAVGIASQIGKNLSGAAEGRLRVDDPFGSACLHQRRSDIDMSNTGAQLVISPYGVAEKLEEAVPEQAREDAYGEEELLVRYGSEAPVVNREPAAGNDAVQVRVQGKGLSPGVKHGEEAELQPQTLWIPSDDQKTLARGTEQDVVEQPRAGQSEGVQNLGDGEDDVEVRQSKDLALARVEPSLASFRLAARTMAVPTRVPDQVAKATPGAAIEMSAHGRSAAVDDGAKSASLCCRQRPMAIELRLDMADDLGERDRRNHLCTPLSGAVCSASGPED